MKRYLPYLCFFLLFLIQCDDKKSPTEPTIESTIKVISAATGGTITAETGISVDFPAGALPQDTEIKLTPFNGTNLHEWCISAVHLEPDGLVLEKAATLSFPLPSDWPQDHQPLIYASFGSDPSDYFDTGLCAKIIKIEDSLFAQTEISHFSSYGPIYNCHKGTLAFLLNSFEEKGCDSDVAWQHVTDEFPNANTDIISTPRTGTETLQAFLGTHFKDEVGFNKDESVNSKWSEIVNNIKSQNKHVVVVFKRDLWGETDHRGFYQGIAHSATLEMKDGKLKLRNSISAGDDVVNAVIDKYGENVIWFPEEDRDITAQDLDDFRNMKSFVAVENVLTDRPDLFSNLPDVSKRIRPWTAARFYVSDFTGSENPCENFPSPPDPEREYLCWINVAVIGHLQRISDSNPDTSYEVIDGVGYGSHQAVGKFSGSPSTGWEFSDQWDETVADYDYQKGTLNITFNKTLTKALNIDLSGEFAYVNSYGNSYPTIIKYELKCSDISIKPWPEAFIPYHGRVEGQTACDKISHFKYYRENVGWWQESLFSYECNAASYIDMRFF